MLDSQGMPLFNRLRARNLAEWHVAHEPPSQGSAN